MSKWDNFRNKAGGIAGKFYLTGTCGLMVKSFTENWNDLSGMIQSKSILDTLSFPVFLASSSIMAKYGNQHIGKAIAFSLSTLGKGMIMTRLAIDDAWGSFAMIGADTAFTVTSAAQSYIRHFKGNKNAITEDKVEEQPLAKTLSKIEKFREDLKDVTKDYPNMPTLGPMALLQAITLGVMISEAQFLYASLTTLNLLGSMLTAISKQHNKPKAIPEPQ